ncbi:MAG: GntR family transcriptional regulator [Syntrophobacteraceae bacterium]|jgi:GntR family transcriptional regulator|nr:GntR family transcriptional regulator [Syntrophobacteraceae bacterium]
MLNPKSPLPLYHQLAEIILAKIRSGELPPGCRLPSEPSLAATYGIGRPTVRQAIDVLVRRRFLTRRRGSGTYVRPEPEEVDLFSLAGTTSAFQKKGISVVSRILEKTRLKSAPVDAENPFSEQPAFFISRLSLVEGTPVLLEEIFMQPELFPGLDEIDLAGRSLSRIVEERYHMRPEGGRQNFRIVNVDGKRAHHLAVTSATPVLLVKRFLTLSGLQNAIYSELYCRTDQFVFSQSIGETSRE